MTHKMGTVGATVAVAAAGLAFIAAAHADALYKADRAYCLSGMASQARELCLTEAAAAQAERQRNTHLTARVHRHPHPHLRHGAVAAPEKRASAPS